MITRIEIQFRIEDFRSHLNVRQVPKFAPYVVVGARFQPKELMSQLLGAHVEVRQRRIFTNRNSYLGWSSEPFNAQTTVDRSVSAMPICMPLSPSGFSPDPKNRGPLVCLPRSCASARA